MSSDKLPRNDFVLRDENTEFRAAQEQLAVGPILNSGKKHGVYTKNFRAPKKCKIKKNKKIKQQ